MLLLIICIVSSNRSFAQGDQGKTTPYDTHKVEFGNYTTSGMKNVALNYMNEHFSKPTSQNWQITSVEAVVSAVSAKTPFKVIFIPRINIGQRFGGEIQYFEKVGLQYQLESYIIPAKRSYFLVYYGYSAARFFARHQANLEWNYALPHKWGVSAGVRMNYWDKPLMSYTVGVERYVGNLWFTLKPTLTIQNKQAFTSVNLGMRRFGKKTMNYLHAALLYGNSPEYANYRPDFRDLLGLQSWGGYVLLQQQLYGGLCVRALVSYRNEEFRDKEFRNVWGGNIGLSLYF